MLGTGCGPVACRRSSTARPDDDLLAVLDALELPRAAVVGMSYGGGTSADFAVTHPDRLWAMVLTGPGLNPMRFDDPFVREHHRIQGEAAAAGDGGAYLDALLRIAVDGPYRTPEQTPAAVRNACRAAAERTMAAHHAATGTVQFRDAAERLEEIEVPTLLVLGELELPDLYRVVADAHRRLRRAERVDVAGAGHMLNMERPEECNRAVLEFLDRPR
ncbi:alpha/beta fold hydrolase [Pseudonocardia nigra]|uniref:alpha/beta fold hydrolase n=1 Tax=Pseudonocardia nigra TaxID=1921578 RepID=UPI001C5EE344|nr:alpha/beta hydrolase [Pseudonocardia nigra]